MPNWNEIVEEIEKTPGTKACDEVRLKYIRALSLHTKRPTIAYYSGWLSKADDSGRVPLQASITDLDMNGFMAVSHGIEKDCGLDLILHTPGGDLEATKGIVDYLRKIFGLDMRVIVPQLAMSAGTMIACSAKEILLGKHSSLGPTDPQVNGYPAAGILNEIDKALEEIKIDPSRLQFWQFVFSKYPPGFVRDCERAKESTERIVEEYLRTNMFENDPNKISVANAIARQITSYDNTSSHAHHFSMEKCEDIGLKIRRIESDQLLQEVVLSVHHSYMATFAMTGALKLVENSNMRSWSVSIG